MWYTSCMHQFDILQAAENVQRVTQQETIIPLPVVVTDRTKDAIVEACYQDPLVTELVQGPLDPFDGMEPQELDVRYQREGLPSLTSFLDENDMTIADWLHDLSSQTGDAFEEVIRQAQAGEWVRLDGQDTETVSDPTNE